MEGTYPHNLLLAIKGSTDLILPAKITQDVSAGIRYALSQLNASEQALLQQRYGNCRSCSALCDSFRVSQEQLLHMEAKALVKLRLPSRWNYIRYGVAGYMKQKALTEYNKGYYAGYQAGYRNGTADTRSGAALCCTEEDALNLPVECLNLSVRAYNSLHRAGYTTLWDIAKLSELDIWKIRNLGRKGADEIARALQDHNVAHTDWNKFLL